MAYFVGIDPASSDAGIAVLDESGDLRTTALCVRGDMPSRLSALRREARAWLGFVAEAGAWCVVVERPITRHGGATLLGSYGVFVEVAASTLDCPVMTPSPSEIDDLVLGRPLSPLKRKARLMQHAQSLGYRGEVQDVADAVVCADAARALTRRSNP